MKERLNIRGFLARLWSNFAPSALLCVAFSGLMVAWDWIPYEKQQLSNLMNRCTMAALMGIGFATLACLLEKRFALKKWLGWAAAAAGMLLGGILWQEGGATAYWGIWIAALLLCVHFACGREHRPQRLGQIAGCAFSSFGLALCLELAIQLCLTAVSALFLADAWRIQNDLNTLAMCLCFLLVMPWLFLGRLPDGETPSENRGGFRKMAANLFLPVYLVFLAILLCYILLIALRWEMPVGQMNWLGLTALALYVMLHLCLTGEENRLARWFTRWGAWLLPPVAVVQQIGVWMRYDAYGITPNRYLGMVITLLLMLVVLWGLLRKRADWFWIGAAITVLLLTISPVNMNQVARWNQEARLKKSLVQCGMLDVSAQRIIANPDASPEHQEKILSAADYLYDLENVPAGSFTAFYQQQKKQDGHFVTNQELFGFGYTDGSATKTYHISGTDSADAVRVEGFRYAEWYSCDYSLDDGDSEDTLGLSANDLLNCADFASETLLKEELLLKDGRTLRICKLSLWERDGQPTKLKLQGWLLTP